jgi:hypothetical protein
MPLHPTNWRPLILCSLLVAQKVWDDRYLSNADFAFIYPFFTTDEINKLEQKFLELIQYEFHGIYMNRYNVTVGSSLYAKYYFELRSLHKENEKDFALQPLNPLEAGQLEIRSNKYKDAFTDVTAEKTKMNSTIGGTDTSKKEKKVKGFACVD